jgi:hypothetical protein
MRIVVAGCAVAALAACSKKVPPPLREAFGLDTSTWTVQALPPPFKTPGALRVPPGATVKPVPKSAGIIITLADGVMIDVMERGATEGRDGDQLAKAFSGYGNEMLDQWRTPTGWVFIYKPGALEGEIAVASSNFAVEPGIDCGKGMAQATITRAQAATIGAVCASLVPK